MVYKYEWSGLNYPVKAQDAGEYLERMSEDGGVTAAKVISEARAEDALLHDCFTWDDSIAAEKYRLREATTLIGSIRKVKVNVIQGEQSKPVRAFVNVTEPSFTGTGIYRPVCEALGVEETRAIVLKRALMEARQFADKYESLTELAAVVAEIRKL